ncbi:hypothetical protein CA830_19435, partial [Burkholderia multivorans]
AGTLAAKLKEREISCGISGCLRIDQHLRITVAPTPNARRSSLPCASCSAEDRGRHGNAAREDAARTGAACCAYCASPVAAISA